MWSLWNEVDLCSQPQSAERLLRAHWTGRRGRIVILQQCTTWRIHYIEWYTREDFERLWRGREEFCPYYDDLEEWDPEQDLQVLEEDGSGSLEHLSGTEEFQGLSKHVMKIEEDTENRLPSL